MSSYNVRKVVEDDKGFLWVATQSGLDRFDGNNFINYKKSNPLKHGLAGIDIREVVEDTIKNMLWVLPGENGVNLINTVTGNVVKTIPVQQQSPDDWNLSMALHGNYLYLGTSVGVKTYDIPNDRFEENLPLPNVGEKKVDAFEVRSIGVDKYNNLWACFSGYGIVVYSPDKSIIAQIQIDSLFDNLKGVSVWFNKLVFTANNEALLATSEGLKKVSYTQNYEFQIEKQPCKAVQAINVAIVENLFESRSGEIYIAALKHLYRFDKTFSTYVLMQEPVSQGAESNWLSDVLNIHEDKSRNLWLGCKQGLAFISNHRTPFKPYYYDPVSNEKIEHVMGVCKLRNNKIIAGLRNGLAIIDEKTGSISTKDKTHIFYHIFEDKDGRINVSREDGMFIYQNNSLVPISIVYPEFKAFSKTLINSHFFKGDSMLVFGTENNTGILLWNYISHRVEKIDKNSLKVKLASGIVNKVYQDKSKNTWVLSDNAITVISDDWTSYKIVKLFDSTRKQPMGLFFDICEAAGDYWIASYGTGIIQIGADLKIKKIYSTSSGLSDDGVYQLYPSKNTILTTTNYGLSVLHLDNKKFQNYYKNDGLHSSYFEEEAGMMKDGILYAGGVNGFTVINPEFFYGNAIPPKLYIERIVTKKDKELVDTSNLFLRTFTIGNNVLETSVYFSALNYQNPSRTTFAYKILEISKEWINLGTTNFVTPVGLSLGTYHLQVKAANEDGVWSEPQELILIFLPKWYQTWWFYLLITLTVTAILYALYRYRIAQIKKQHQIRKNIATDLHDDLGSTLNSVKVFTNLAISGVKQEESLQQVKDNLTEATMSLRDTIWVLDDSLDTVDELITRLKQFAIPVAAASNFEALIKADSEINNRQLTKEEKRNLFLICKEAINNGIKYSGASQITVTIIASGKKIQIVVTDNGKGFNVDEVKKGYGLKNMQYRAGQIKYTVALVSSPGNGTQITILPS